MTNGGNNGSVRDWDTHWQKRKMKRKFWVVTRNNNDSDAKLLTWQIFQRGNYNIYRLTLSL